MLALFDQALVHKVKETVIGNSSSVSSQIARELRALKEDSNLYRFGCELSRGVGIIHFGCELSPSQFLHSFLTNLCPTVCPAFVSRVIPIDIVCAPNVSSFTSVCIPLIGKKFAEYSGDRTWKLVFEKHALTNLDKELVLSLIHEVIPERHEASITSPDVVVMVQTFQTTCGVGFLEDFEILEEYNIRKLIFKNSKISNDDS